MKERKKTFDSEGSFEWGVVRRLNEICREHGAPEYFTHNGFGGKYCSVICSHCNKSALFWFTFEGSKDNPHNIAFFRPPYGFKMHRDEVESHLPGTTVQVKRGAAAKKKTT